jgi:hypothetical protein
VRHSTTPNPPNNLPISEIILAAPVQPNHREARQRFVTDAAMYSTYHVPCRGHPRHREPNWDVVRPHGQWSGNPRAPRDPRPNPYGQGSWKDRTGLHRDDANNDTSPSSRMRAYNTSLPRHGGASIGSGRRGGGYLPKSRRKRRSRSLDRGYHSDGDYAENRPSWDSSPASSPPRGAPFSAMPVHQVPGENWYEDDEAQRCGPSLASLVCTEAPGRLQYPVDQPEVLPRLSHTLTRLAAVSTHFNARGMHAGSTLKL